MTKLSENYRFGNLITWAVVYNVDCLQMCVQMCGGIRPSSAKAA